MRRDWFFGLEQLKYDYSLDGYSNMSSQVKIHPSFRHWSKRGLDLLLAVAGLLLATPLFLCAYPFLLVLIGRPVLFRQQRSGQKGRSFAMYKLRSMVKNAPQLRNKYLAANQAPAPLFKISQDPRFIRKKLALPWMESGLELNIGAFLSQTGLDELPQLINIAKGEMSFFGPRPLPVAEAQALQKIDPDWWQWRHSVKPGIFSVWAAEKTYRQKLATWRRLEEQTLKLGLAAQAEVTMRICRQQLHNVWRKILRT